MGCGLTGEEFVKSLGIEADHHLIAHHQGGCSAAAILVHQFLHRLRVAGDVALFELDPSLREVGFRRPARRSAGLGEDLDPLGCHLDSRLANP
jgi:hypothetical protein